MAIDDGAEIGEPPDSSVPTTPQDTDHILQRTARSARRIARHSVTAASPTSAVLTTVAVQASTDMPTPSVCSSVRVLPPGDAGHAPAFFVSSSDALALGPLPFPSRLPSHVERRFSEPDRTEREYGTTARSRRSGPVSEGCSTLRVPYFSTTPLGQVNFEPARSEDAKRDAEASRAHQERSLSPSGRQQQQEGFSPHGERR